MTDEASSQSSRDLVARILEEAESGHVFLPSSRRLRDIVEIATEARSRLALIKSMQAHGGGELVDIIVDAFEDAGDKLEGRADMTNATIELLDRAALPVSTAALLSGVGLLVGTGNRFGSATLLACGAVALSIAAFGRIRLKAYESSGRIAAKKIRRLSSELRSRS